MSSGTYRNKKPTSILDKFSSLRGLEKRKKTSRYNDGGLENLHQLQAIQQKIGLLSKHDVNIKFEQMLDDMNLTEEKKAPLRMRTTEQKRSMLAMHFKGTMQSHGNIDTVEGFIQEMNRNDLKGDARYDVVSSLRVALTNNPVSWVINFGMKNGLNGILKCLSYSCDDQSERRSTLECIKCLRAYTNNKHGLMQLIKHEEALVLLCRCVDARDAQSMLEAVKLIAAICLVPPIGHEKVLEATSICGEIRCHERFLTIVQGLNVKDTQMKIVCLQLINAIVSTPDELDFRLHLRNEFLRVGLQEHVLSLEQHINEEVQSQMRIFLEHKDEDAEEFSHRYDNLRLDMDDPRECFELLLNLTIDTPSENYFLSILQHLLAIREDTYARPQYFQLIEECVTQIVLHRNGCDPDFKYKRFQIDVEPLLGKLTEDSMEYGSSNNLNSLAMPRQFRQKFEEAMTLKQELEAKVGSLEVKVKSYEEEIQMLKSKISGDIGSTISSALINNNTTTTTTTTTNDSQSNVPVPPPLPPLAGFPQAPPIPGSLLPPPPPIGNLLQSSVVQLPSFVKPKKKYNPSTQLKRANWVKINPSSLQPDSFWTVLNEEKFASNDLFDQLINNFAFKSINKPDTNTESDKPLKKIKELKVLDTKTAQNLSILLGSVKVPYDEIKRRILRVDESKLKVGFVDQLIKLLPPQDQLNKLALLKDQYQELSEPEQFGVVISSIKRLEPRLTSIEFKMKFNEVVNEIKPEMVSSLVAMEEVRNSVKLADVMAIILLLGNYMNAGSRNEQTIGFEMSFMPKLINTKSTDNSRTLMHFIVEYIQQNHAHLLNFSQELSHVDKAARVSEDSLQKSILKMGKQVKQLEIDLKNAQHDRRKHDEDEDADAEDGFIRVMTPFLETSTSQYSVLEGMLNNMSTKYKDMSKYFCYDPKKYTMEEFFGDLKMFIDHFEQARKDLDRLKDLEEKQKRQKEMLMRREEEREEKRRRKMMIIDINADDDQEGVMDNLLEALKTGSAFHVSRERKDNKKRTPRIAGAERRAQLARSRSRQNVLSPDTSITIAPSLQHQQHQQPQHQQPQPQQPQHQQQQRQQQQQYKQQQSTNIQTILFEDVVDTNYDNNGKIASTTSTTTNNKIVRSPKSNNNINNNNNNKKTKKSTNNNNNNINNNSQLPPKSTKTNTPPSRQRTQFATQHQQSKISTSSSSSPSTSFKKTTSSSSSSSPSKGKFSSSPSSSSPASKTSKQKQTTTNKNMNSPSTPRNIKSSSSQPPSSSSSSSSSSQPPPPSSSSSSQLPPSLASSSQPSSSSLTETQKLLEKLRAM